MVTIVPVDFSDVKFLARPARPIFPLINNGFGGGGVKPIFGEMLFENGKTMLFEKSPDTEMVYEGSIIDLFATQEGDAWITQQGENWKEQHG